MTEEEAKTKWCPFARTLGTLTRHHAETESERVVSSGSANRGYQMGGALHNCMCIGSACMAFRDKGPEGEITQTQVGAVTSIPRYGYCGLAGKP
jgi:hypothetical protein